MKNFKNLVLAGLILLSVAFLGYSTNQKAPDFTLTSSKNTVVTLSNEFKDSFVILDFWATWCAPCMAAHPGLDDVQKKYKDKVKVFAIAVDPAKDESRVLAYDKKNNYSFTILLDKNQEVMKKYGVSDVPRLFVIDKNGNVVLMLRNMTKSNEKKLEEFLEKNLK